MRPKVFFKILLFFFFKKHFFIHFCGKFLSIIKKKLVGDTSLAFPAYISSSLKILDIVFFKSKTWGSIITLNCIIQGSVTLKLLEKEKKNMLEESQHLITTFTVMQTDARTCESISVPLHTTLTHKPFLCVMTQIRFNTEV